MDTLVFEKSEERVNDLLAQLRKASRAHALAIHNRDEKVAVYAATEASLRAQVQEAQAEHGKLIREHIVSEEFAGYKLTPESTGQSIAFNDGEVTLTHDARRAGSSNLSREQAILLAAALSEHYNF